MNEIAFLDVSAFIWDENHYAANTPEYYRLMDTLPNLYQEILSNNIPIWLRPELYMEIMTYFPYKSIPGSYYPFELSTLFFLSQAKMAEYNSDDDPTVSSLPSLEKNFFKSTTKKEMRYLMTRLYNNRDECQKFLSFHVFVDGHNRLIIKNGYELNLETVICDDVNEHGDIISNFKKIFRHNPKHDKYKSSEEEYHGEVISPLSCYNDRIEDTTEAQKLLDKSVSFKKKGFYAYDDNHETYVKFVHTEKNKFHGFDVVLTETDLIEIKEIFHKENG